ncbi:MAG: hypothetical protein KDD28_27060 [Phaeodactylibacter sp.]|nr:hypothetical protein [Phaeodactylibacter sp.]
MSETKEKKQILNDVDDMIRFFEKQVSDNQKGIQSAEGRIDAANAEIVRSTAEIKERVGLGKELASKLATWTQQRTTLENL